MQGNNTTIFIPKEKISPSKETDDNSSFQIKSKGYNVRPHLRKGHYQRFKCGPRNDKSKQYYKTLFIKDIEVNKELDKNSCLKNDLVIHKIKTSGEKQWEV